MPRLDRQAARGDLGAIAEWERDVEAAYRKVLRQMTPFSPGSVADGPDGLSELEHTVLDDREWAEGYRRGRADAGRAIDRRQGPGVMPDDPKDGWSPSITRQSGYDQGVQDGL